MVDKMWNCPFAHFYMPDLIKQNLCFAMLSAFKGNSRIFISFVFYSVKELLERNLNFAKTWNTDSVVINSNGSIVAGRRAS
jgi:hypothetical protein